VSYFVFYNLNIFTLSMGKFGVRRVNHPIMIQEFFCSNWMIYTSDPELFPFHLEI